MAAVFALPSRVTVGDAAEVVGHALATLGEAGASEAWSLDAGKLEVFDSACLALLLELRRRAGARPFEVRSAPKRLAELAAAYGVEFALGNPGSPPADVAASTDRM